MMRKPNVWTMMIVLLMAGLGLVGSARADTIGKPKHCDVDKAPARAIDMVNPFTGNAIVVEALDLRLDPSPFEPGAALVEVKPMPCGTARSIDGGDPFTTTKQDDVPLSPSTRTARAIDIDNPFD